MNKVLKQIMIITRRPKALLIILILIAIGQTLAPPPAQSQRPGANKDEISFRPKPKLKFGHIYKRAGVNAKLLPFTQRDFLRMTVRAPKTRIFMGEPLLLELRLINHTRFTIGLTTNLNPRGDLNIKIQPEKKSSRRYYSHWRPGQFVPRDYMFYPNEERTFKVVIWSDRETPNGLAFPEPGLYRVSLDLAVEVQMSQITGDQPIKPNDPHYYSQSPHYRSLTPIEIEVLAPPTPDAAGSELLQTLIQANAFPELHRREIPAELEDQFFDLIDRYPDTYLTPYLNFAAGVNLWNRLRGVEGTKKDLTQAVIYFQRLALSNTIYANDALLELIKIYDEKDMTLLAWETCDRLMKKVKPREAVFFGSLTYVSKYLINTAEISPTDYWHLLE